MPYKFIKIFILTIIIVILNLSIIYCSNNESKNTELLVFAPASMSDVLPEVLLDFKDPDINVIFDFGGSAILASKISNGAPANIYISAGTSTFKILESNNLLAKAPETIVKNSLIVVATKEFQNLNTIYDIEKKEISRIAIANPDFAPAGEYAIEALRNLKIWNSIKDKVVFGADVRSTLNYVITENSDIAIVYASDILSTSLKPIKIIPKDSYSNIIYPATIIKNSKNQAESEKFLQHLLSESSQKIFYKYGFIPVINIESSK